MYTELAEIIIANEKNDHRFEQFCAALLGKHEGVSYVPTSQSWDFGRDARATNPGKGTHSNILCATLNEQIDSKVEADLLRLTAHASPDRLVYCSSQRLSELRVDEIRATISRHAQRASILVVGARQLAAMCKRSEAEEAIFEQHYGAELREIRATVFSENPSGAPSNGLRLALLTFGSEEGSSLRHDVLQSTLLDRMSQSESLTTQQICNSFCTDLGLARALPESFLNHILYEASEEGDVQRAIDGWRLTSKGLQKKNALPLEGVQHLLEGRTIIRSQLETLLGKRIENTQFSNLWSRLMDTLGSLFHANGLEIVRGVEQLLSGKGDSEEPLDLKRLLENGMRSTVSIIGTPDLRDSTQRALLDIFTERQGEGFNWLTRVAERFVTLCAIGLENSSGEALREALTSQRVVLDSDIILNYLCKAEPDYAATRDLLTKWLNIGGKVLVSPVVLEEVAHNAWISDNDFRATETLLGKLQASELPRYIKSPFVRTFHSLSAPAEQWQIFLGQYRGNSAGDYTKILRHLKGGLKAEVLPAAYPEDLKDKIVEYIRRIPQTVDADAEHIEDVTYKVERDGKLLASIAHARNESDLAGHDSPMVLLSSSGILRSAELKFRAELGEARVVLNKRAFSYLLAAVPQVGLGADTLRRALFDFGSHSRLRSHERRALRIIRSAAIYDLPWAERLTLRQQLSKSIKRDADRRGLTRKQAMDQMAQSSAAEASAGIIIEAVQNMAIPTNLERELVESKKRVRELERELDAQRALESRNRGYGKTRPTTKH